MELFVYSRDAIARITPHEVSHAIVSITSGETDVARFPIPPTCRGVLRLVFADLTPDEVDPLHRDYLFTEKQARAVWAFVAEHERAIERVLVHCDAGHSRSPAIAAALARYFGDDDAPYFERYEPNRWVLETMAKTMPPRSR